MNADERRFDHAELSHRVIGVFFDVYNELGYGFLESVYENAMAIALEAAGLHVARQMPITIRFRGIVVGEFRADYLVNGVLIVELKAVRTWETCHEAQLLNYLRGSDLETSLLFNFGVRPQFKRLVFGNSRKISVHPRSSAADPDRPPRQRT